jgi:hypothetical protein
VAPIKTKEQFFEPDPTNKAFPGLSLETHYEMVSQYCSLHDGVPEDVRDYFNSVVMLYLHGWLYYPFFTTAGFLSTFIIEMALRDRLPASNLNKKGMDLRFVGDLRDEDFPSLKNRRTHSDELSRIMAETLGVQATAESPEPYVETLIRWLPKVRNDFAHPKMQSILPPGMAFDGLMLTAEIINALWPKR